LSTIPNQIDPLDAAASSPAEATPVPAGGDDPLHRHRLERSRRLKQSVFSSLLIKPLAVVVPIVTIPLFVTYLGSKERYGLYEAVGALALWLAMVNVGMNLGLINKLTDCHVSGDRERARLYVSTLTIAMGVILIVCGAIFTLITMMVNWVSVWDLREPLAQAEARPAMLVGGIITLVGIFSGIPAAIYAGYQEVHRYNYWDGASKIAVLIASAVLVWVPPLRNWGVVGVLLAAAGMPTLIRLVNLVSIFCVEKPWMRPSLRLFDPSTLRVMLGQGISLFVLQMSVIALFQTDKLIISTAIDAESVAGYSILGRIFLSVFGLYALLLAPLWPAYGEAIRRDDIPWVRRQVVRMRVAGCGLMLAFGLFMLVFGGWVIRMLSPNSGITVSNNLIIAMTAMFIVRALAESQSIVLNAANVLVPQVLVFGGHAVLNIIVAILLAPRFGVEGVAWSATITGLVTTVWGYPWMIHKYVLKPKGGGA
jgi:O-antigen/teichoic acid export membrane protein